jgi:hypothetical protein
VTFPCEQLLRGGAAGGSGDFSLCLWVLLARGPTGSHRTLLTRGRGAERWPAVLLRDADCRLEVCFGGAAMGTLCERLTSKEALPVGRCVQLQLVLLSSDVCGRVYGPVMSLISCSSQLLGVIASVTLVLLVFDICCYVTAL